jgi:hypothetical protein
MPFALFQQLVRPFLQRNITGGSQLGLFAQPLEWQAKSDAAMMC